MNKRVGAAEALEITPEIKDFISAGVPQQALPNTESESRQNPTEQRSDQRISTVADAPGRGNTGVPPKKKASSPKTPKKSIAQPRPDRVHSKARVQKTVRFLPHLITQLDEYLRALPLGQELSFQDVANEALQMWLDRHASV